MSRRLWTRQSERTAGNASMPQLGNWTISPLSKYIFPCYMIWTLKLNSHAGHMPYLWQGALSIVSQTLLVMGATMSASLSSILSSLVSSPDTVDTIINKVVMEIERYAHLAPSLSLSAEIIRE